MVAGLEPDSVEDLVAMAEEICFSDVGRDGTYVGQTDYHRVYEGEKFRIEHLYAPDAPERIAGFTRVRFSGQRVLDRTRGKEDFYLPGEWEEELRAKFVSLSELQKKDQ